MDKMLRDSKTFKFSKYSTLNSKNSQPPVKPVPDTRDDKVLYSIFFDSNRAVTHTLVPE